VLVLELRQYLFQDWIPVAHASELGSAGDRIRCSVATREFLLVRHTDAKVLAFRNRCLHAGYPIVEAGDPSNGAELLCKYHAWRYGLDGELRQPQLPAMSGAPCLQRYGVALVGGLVYLHPSLQKPETEPVAPDTADWLPHARTMRHSIELSVNWKTLACEPDRMARLLPPSAQGRMQPCGRLAWFAGSEHAAALVRLAPRDACATTVSILLMSPPGAARETVSDWPPGIPAVVAELPCEPGSARHTFYTDYLAALQTQA
jgi:nitrite reductase/ring-hydroxylating ferredoxin subunit